MVPLLLLLQKRDGIIKVMGDLFHGIQIISTNNASPRCSWAVKIKY